MLWLHPFGECSSPDFLGLALEVMAMTQNHIGEVQDFCVVNCACLAYASALCLVPWYRLWPGQALRASRAGCFRKEPSSQGSCAHLTLCAYRQQARVACGHQALCVRKDCCSQAITLFLSQLRIIYVRPGSYASATSQHFMPRRSRSRLL